MAHELSGNESLQGDTFFGGVAPTLPVKDSGSLVKQSFESKPETIKPPVRNESFDVNKELFRIANSDQKINENSEPKPAQDDTYAADDQGAQSYPVDAPRRVLMSPTPAPTPSPDTLLSGLKPRTDPGQPGV